MTPLPADARAVDCKTKRAEISSVFPRWCGARRAVFLTIVRRIMPLIILEDYFFKPLLLGAFTLDGVRSGFSSVHEKLSLGVIELKDWKSRGFTM